MPEKKLTKEDKERLSKDFALHKREERMKDGRKIYFFTFGTSSLPSSGEGSTSEGSSNTSKS